MKCRIAWLSSLVLLFGLTACAPAAPPTPTVAPKATTAAVTPTSIAATPTVGAAQMVTPTAAPKPTIAAATPTAAGTMPTVGATKPAAPTAAATLAIGQNATLGQFLTDNQGLTLYVFLQDTSSQSTCFDACAQRWPPLLTQGPPTGQTGVNSGFLGTSQRTDGTTQVTYNGHPLYRYSGDQKPGDTNGQGVGSIWYVVSPAGDPIKK